MLARGRVLKLDVSANDVTLVPVSGSAEIPTARLLPKAVVDAAENAALIVSQAEARAKTILEEAEASAQETRAKAAEDGRAEGAAALASAWLRLRAEEAARDERELEGTLSLARMIAERLLGETLALDPSRVLGIARQALAQARLARRITIFAHPEDAALLAREKAALGLEPAVVELHADATLSRGSLRLETDLGILDADLAPQLDRLIAALRDGLRTG